LEREIRRMANIDKTLRIYEQLAEWYDGAGQPKLRDWFLVLAADAALSAGRSEVAERYRQRLLQLNPHHLLKPFATFAEALESGDIKGYVADLRVTYPPEVARDLFDAQRKKLAETPKGGESPGRALARSGTPAPPFAPPFAPPAQTDEPDLKVYRVKTGTAGSSEPSAPSARRAASVPAAAPPRAPAPSAPESTWIPPSVAPTRHTPAGPVSRPPARNSAAPAPDGTGQHTNFWPAVDDPDTATGSWISTALFAVVLLLTLGFAMYTLARPFLPAQWLR
jgi:hypothetical protein